MQFDVLTDVFQVHGSCVRATAELRVDGFAYGDDYIHIEIEVDPSDYEGGVDEAMRSALGRAVKQLGEHILASKPDPAEMDIPLGRIFRKAPAHLAGIQFSSAAEEQSDRQSLENVARVLEVPFEELRVCHEDDADGRGFNRDGAVEDLIKVGTPLVSTGGFDLYHLKGTAPGWTVARWHQWSGGYWAASPVAAEEIEKRHVKVK